MEKRINKKVVEYITGFKNDIKSKSVQLNINNTEQTTQLLQYIYDYERFALNKDDFAKRKRVKNVVPFFDRCSAKRANNEQCTRKKKDNCEFCGTHTKGTPHGCIDLETHAKPTTHPIEVWAQNIRGIIYYLDTNFNVYQTEDIIMGKDNPAIIAKYVKNMDEYSIPEFGI